MTFITPNADEMKRKRGRPTKNASEVKQAEEKASAPPESQETPQERLVPLILRRGWWPFDGTVYFDADGNRRVYKTPMTTNGEVDEMARKTQKFLPGTRVHIPVHLAKPLLDTGKAELDTSL